ncbi:hypothetical protein BU24DRAFT_410503 [Aaosphaeria arxii CBS 175.79]|uniref:Uncharacterized protein n=1 Tax=Aaosphaeria arxii CBS 175.79 TaxID=1450172 RepID=A0A6A5XPN5_9PLEO|nr:uncharacterized protein BU24DRAFT_410503 [Aaosphaeria arxii CBS 175.79]KAF2014797.1 hypothetical protein BU24DRAFT_410503 [Aaosphaeria arxii CBS 175.79]
MGDGSQARERCQLVQCFSWPAVLRASAIKVSTGQGWSDYGGGGGGGAGGQDGGGGGEAEVQARCARYGKEETGKREQQLFSGCGQARGGSMTVSGQTKDGAADGDKCSRMQRDADGSLVRSSVQMLCSVRNWPSVCSFDPRTGESTFVAALYMQVV